VKGASGLGAAADAELVAALLGATAADVAVDASADADVARVPSSECRGEQESAQSAKAAMWKRIGANAP
jgi:hypothetical protein